jgi:hypothetical protein
VSFHTYGFVFADRSETAPSRSRLGKERLGKERLGKENRLRAAARQGESVPCRDREGRESVPSRDREGAVHLRPSPDF